MMVIEMAESDQRGRVCNTARARDLDSCFQPGPGGLERQIAGPFANDLADRRNDVVLPGATGHDIAEP